MAKSRTWMIGAAPECDVVIDRPTISSRHCRLTAAADGYLLEDLGSTNGTYINGRRLQGGQHVSERDQIRLGADVAFPWDRIKNPVPAGRVIRIGRTADNDVVLDYPMVSSQHARITVRGKELTIEDLGSSNGTSIGSPDQRIKSAPFQPNDTIYFGSLAVPASQLLRPGRPAATSTPAARGGGYGVFASRNLIIAGAAAGLLLVVGLAWALWPRGNTPVVPPASAVPDTGKPAEKVGEGSGAANQAQATTVREKTPVQSVYAVLLQDFKTGEFLTIGSATAVSPRHLATSASVAYQVENLKREFPVAKVRAAGEGREFVIQKSTAHPLFLKAREEEVAAGNAAAEIRGVLEAASKKVDDKEDPATGNAAAPLSKEELEQKTNALIEHEEQRFQAIEREMYFDVGLLEVAGPLPETAPLGENRLPEINRAVALVGIGVPHDNLVFDAARPLAPAIRTGRIGEVTHSQTGGRGNARLMVHWPIELEMRSWFGSGVRDEAGTLIAVFSRPAPPEKPDMPPQGDKFDAALVNRLRDFAPELWSQSPLPLKSE